MFDFDLSSTGSFSSDFAKGFAVPFQAVGELGGAALGGLFKGAEDVPGDVGNAIGGFLDGVVGSSGFKYILIAGGAVLLFFVIRK